MCCAQEVQDRIDGMATELSKAMKKDLQESGLRCQAQFSELCNQLASRKAEITAKTEAYQKVHLHWKQHILHLVSGVHRTSMTPCKGSLA